MTNSRRKGNVNQLQKMVNRKRDLRMTIQALIKEIKASYKYWYEIAEYGCSDPFWPDGANMNLVRNHIIYFKNQLINQAEEEQQSIPPEVYWAIPPEVPNSFMVRDGKYYKIRCKNWDKESVSRIVLNADTDMSLF